jgi:hypothetical protein
MNAAAIYHANGKHERGDCLAFDVNKALVRAGGQIITDPYWRGVIGDLDACISQIEEGGALVLFRGCAFSPGNPIIDGRFALFRSYLSTSRLFSFAYAFLRTCHPEDGEGHMLKIIYPSSSPHCSLDRYDEHEVLLPGDCRFEIANWILDEAELDSLGVAERESFRAATRLTMRCVE